MKMSKPRTKFYLYVTQKCAAGIDDVTVMCYTSLISIRGGGAMITEYKNSGEALCPECGRKHPTFLRGYSVGHGALSDVPECITRLGGEFPYVLCDRETYEAAGGKVCGILDANGIRYHLYIIGRKTPAPDEYTVGEAVMNCPTDCDCVIAVGGGVINDTGKIIASQKKSPMLMVSTAPSMDGLASATSSMERGGLKLSLNTKCPDYVIGDTAVLASAPKKLIVSGIGDMLAKYVSLTEWRIAHLLIDEYYCHAVADVVRRSLDKCVENAYGAVSGDESAAAAVTEGLITSGTAMNMAGVSRPASGMEHYISHVIDMRALEFGTPKELHGIQCGIGTLYTVRLYEKLKKYLSAGPIDIEEAVRHAERFDYAEYSAKMREKLGRGADIMIANEMKENKYSPEGAKKRAERVNERREELCRIIDALPLSDKLYELMKKIGHPTDLHEIGLGDDEIRCAETYARDIRDKYVLGRLLWDIGIEGWF